MQKISLTIVVACLLVGTVVTVNQGGRATTITLLSWVPLALYVLYWIVTWIISAVTKKKDA